LAEHVTSADFQERLQTRAESANLTIPARLLPPLETYYRLLARWNVRINLTALELDPLSDAAIDRLFLEPLSAARFVPIPPRLVWFDVGSGGGSPALPLLLALPTLQLTMIESRARKGAFLREAVRTLELDANVETRRFEDVVLSEGRNAGLVTARAVRVDGRFLDAAASLLCPGGILALFHAGGIDSDLLSRACLTAQAPIDLFAGGSHQLSVLRYVPRGTQLG
jgi:16S rRNA (guanine527-N7)-methyltransferase